MFIPWDQDQPFGQFPRGTEEQREGLSIRKPWSGENRFLERVFNSRVFYAAYLGALREYNGSILQPERMDRQVGELAAVLRPAIAEESPVRLSEFEKAVAGEKMSVSMGPGFSGPISVKPVRGFVKARGGAVADQLAGKSEGKVLSPGFGGR